MGQNLPETISVDTALGSLRNRERQDCSIRARTLVLAKLLPSMVIAWSNPVKATVTGAETRIS